MHCILNIYTCEKNRNEIFRKYTIVFFRNQITNNLWYVPRGVFSKTDPSQTPRSKQRRGVCKYEEFVFYEAQV